MNSAVSLLRLWHLCVRSQGDGETGVLRWGTLRQALKGVGGRVQSLRCTSVDDILRRHFGSERGDRGHVSFTRYWRGMEAILEACGAFHGGGVDYETEQKVASLRSFRDAVLEELESSCNPNEDSESGTYLVLDLRVICWRLRRAAAPTEPTVAAYWEERLGGLPADEESVTGDEIASALLAWLEDLLKEEFVMDNGEAEPVLELESDGHESSGGEEEEASWGPPASAPRGSGSGVGGTGSGGRSGGGGGYATSAVPLAPPPPRRPGSGVFSGSGGYPGGGGSSASAAPPATTSNSPHEDYPVMGSLRRGVAKTSHGSGGTGPLSRVPSWLMEEQDVGPEEEKFRELLAKHLDDGGGTFIDLYRAVRDAVDDEGGLDPGGGTPRRSGASGYRVPGPAAVRAGATRLGVVVRHRLRESFRCLEIEMAPPDGGGREPGARGRASSKGSSGGRRLSVGAGAGVGHNELTVALLCSQAQTAKVLERRAQFVPYAYRIAWLLARVRQRFVAQAFKQWLAEDDSAAGTPPLEQSSPPTSGRCSSVGGAGSTGGSRFVLGEPPVEFFPLDQQQQPNQASAQPNAPLQMTQPQTAPQQLVQQAPAGPPMLLALTPPAPAQGIALAPLPVPSHQQQVQPHQQQVQQVQQQVQQVMVPVTTVGPPQQVPVHVSPVGMGPPPGSARLTTAERSPGLTHRASGGERSPGIVVGASVQLSPNLTHRSTLTTGNSSSAPSPSPATRRWGGGQRSPTSPSPNPGGSMPMTRVAPSAHMAGNASPMVAGTLSGTESAPPGTGAPPQRRGPPRGLTIRLDSP